jgi:hypothetical protein
MLVLNKNNFIYIWGGKDIDNGGTEAYSDEDKDDGEDETKNLQRRRLTLAITMQLPIFNLQY